MRRLIVTLVVGLLAGGCASAPPAGGVDYDPWESSNRKLYRFNEVIDGATLKPIAKGYNAVLPEPVRKGVTNFSRNLATPGSALNNVLQGKPGKGLQEFARFIINTTFGIAGFIDIATIGGVEANPEDFGQTFATWGIPSGPYLMVPFLGPQTIRELAALPLDIQVDRLHHQASASVRDPIWALRIINLRARLLSVEELLKDSKDPYITVRESYLQNRRFLIYDGDPPLVDDEELYDEFLEDEDY